MKDFFSNLSVPKAIVVAGIIVGVCVLQGMGALPPSAKQALTALGIVLANQLQAAWSSKDSAS